MKKKKPTIDSNLQWAKRDKVWKMTNQSIPTLEPGYYLPEFNHNGDPVLHEAQLKTDDLIYPDDPKIEEIEKEISSFWDKKEIFKKYGFLHRRGYLFHGPPGSGKSAFVSLVIQDFLKNIKGVVLSGENIYSLESNLINLREVEPERPLIVVMEDLDSLIKEFPERELLDFLDGSSQIDHVIILATTNFPENLPSRIKHRPRRFDRMVEIGMPSTSVRRQFLEVKLKIEKSEIEDWVEMTDGFSFAAMTDLAISVRCFNNSVEESVEKLKKHLSKKITSDDYESYTSRGRRAGFFLDRIARNTSREYVEDDC